MSADTITELILQYRYWILIPLSIIEGPIAAFVAGTLAAAGYFSIYFLAVLFLIRDLGLDGLFYAVGYFGSSTSLVQRMLGKIGVTPDHLEQLGTVWRRRPGTTLFVGKLAYGIAAAFIMAAGMIRMPLLTFFKYGSAVAILQYGTLLFAGYYLGTSAGGNIVHIINNVQYVVGVTALAIAAYYLLSWHMRRRLLAEDKKIEELPVGVPLPADREER